LKCYDDSARETEMKGEKRERKKDHDDTSHATLRESKEDSGI
jgi:hypothetical protein